MSNEELLRPRWKVRINYPGCQFKIGEIIVKHKYASGNWYVPNFMYQPENYPEIFEALEWYEERDESDMPKYVRCGNLIHEVKRWVGSFQNICWIGCHVNDTSTFVYSQKLQPATITEYKQYIDQQKQTNDTER